MADLSIPLYGLSQAESRVNTAASRIARMGSPAVAGSEDNVDLSGEMVALMESKNAYAVNAKVAQTFDQMNGSLLNILA